MNPYLEAIAVGAAAAAITFIAGVGAEKSTAAATPAVTSRAPAPVTVVHPGLRADRFAARWPPHHSLRAAIR